ncbi:MAG: hypothetical protein ABGY71_08340 [bacterium]|nr:hypothetical protein [Planctomycetota bacterium]HIL51996.1 hypothetical protein [Planctomycetota bacterium]
MKLLRPRAAAPKRRGAALLLSILVLFVLIAIVMQISIGTMTDARVGRNDVGQTLINRAISSAQYDIFELLKNDAESSQEEGGEDPAAGAMADATAGAMGAEGGAEEAAAVDSRRDEWAVRQRTEINGIEVLIQIEAENSKYNILNMLNEDEEEAEDALQRVARIIDLYREGTEDDISQREAQEMAEAMKSHMTERHGSGYAEPALLTFNEDRDKLFMPLSLRDFLVLEAFAEHDFRSYRDVNDARVHSLDQFLTVWSSPSLFGDSGASSENGSGQSGAGGGGGSAPSGGSSSGASSTTKSASGAGGTEDFFNQALADSESGGNSGLGEGSSGDSGAASGTGSSGLPGSGEESSSSGPALGYGVNVNLAPPAVLKGLFDVRDVRPRFWDDVIEYRNLEEEQDFSEKQPEPTFDEFGDELIERQIFDSATELSDVRSWEDLDPLMQSAVMSLVEVESEVFTIYITGRRNTSVDDGADSAMTAEERARAEEEPGGALVRCVRVVVWRRSTDDGVEVLFIVPWEELDFTPFEVEDYPDEY